MSKKKDLKKKAAQIVKLTKKDIKYVKELRALGASNQEIAKALDIPEDSLLFS